MQRYHYQTVLRQISLAILLAGVCGCGTEDALDAAKHGTKSSSGSRNKKASDTVADVVPTHPVPNAAAAGDETAGADGSDAPEEYDNTAPAVFALTETQGQFAGFVSFDALKDTCSNTHGTWNAALLHCVCPDKFLFRLGQGCVDAGALATASPCPSNFASLSADDFKACAATFGVSGLHVALDTNVLSKADTTLLQTNLDTRWTDLFIGATLPADGAAQAARYSNQLSLVLPQAAAVVANDQDLTQGDFVAPWDPSMKGADLLAGEVACIKSLSNHRTAEDKPLLQSMCKALFGALRGINDASIQPPLGTSALSLTHSTHGDGSALQILRGDLGEQAASLVYRVHIKADVPLTRSVTVSLHDKWRMTTFVSPLGYVVGTVLDKVTKTPTGKVHVATSLYDSTFKPVKKAS